MTWDAGPWALKSNPRPLNRNRNGVQQLRVWNKFQDVLLDEVKPPVVLRFETPNPKRQALHRQIATP